MAGIEPHADGVLLRVRVQPKASRNAVCLEPGGRIRVALTAPPVEGAANKALKAFIAKQLHVPKSAVELVSGEKSREKALLLKGVDAEAVRRELGL